ncbi:MAG: hypothetical protein SWH54_12625 [Thermodesulfobacteriota bacterium]|nr:hypothetical protein [Thermodesulfobacteriota bacterium]
MMNSNIMDMIFFEIGKNFSTGAYMWTTKVQGILWSISDVVIIYVILKIASLIREKNQKQKIRFRYILMWMSAVLVPFLLFTITPRQFFILESVIFGLQFSVLIYSLIAETKDTITFFRKLVAD